MGGWAEASRGEDGAGQGGQHKRGGPPSGSLPRKGGRTSGRTRRSKLADKDIQREREAGDESGGPAGTGGKKAKPTTNLAAGTNGGNGGAGTGRRAQTCQEAAGLSDGARSLAGNVTGPVERPNKKLSWDGARGSTRSV